MDEVTVMGFYVIFIIFFFFISLQPAYSYIDPGTGSMLFSVIIGIISVGLFAVKTAMHRISTLSFWHGRDSKKTMRGSGKNFVIYSEGGQYWNVFKPVVEEFDRRKIQFHYYTSDESDPCFNFTSDYMTAAFIGKGNKAYAKLNMLEADLCLMTTPGLDVYQLKCSKFVKHYSHIVHAPGDATLYRLFGLDYFDSVLLTGEYQKSDLRKLESLRNTKTKELIVTGCTYLDVLKTELDKIDKAKTSDATTVLVAPSWGDSSLLKKYGMTLLKPLAESGFNIIIRPHPQSLVSEKEIIDRLMNTLKDEGNVRWDFERNNIHAMAKSDILISDFSGIIFDYLFLTLKPVMYASYNFDRRPYDAGDLDNELWQFEALKEIGIKLHEDDFASIKEIVEKNIKNNALIRKIEQAKNEAYFYPGESGIKTVDALVELRNKAVNI